MTDTLRPDPDDLLARIATEEARRSRGRLKVFLGAAAGVGKTYAMLEAAQARRAAGVDVVVGWAEPHGRAETEALLEGLDTVPPRPIVHRGVALRELDLDAVLARRPALVVVDELAHSNAPGSRHAKRWQDVEELLDAGIDVYTTLNIQHVESLNDVVAQITGVVTRETVPDTLLEDADEITLVDLPPDDLLRRLREGKVYVPARAETAMERFFRPGNLMALRELALRRTADRVDAQMRDYRRDHAIRQAWPATDRVLVCISANPLAPRLVRAGHRLAQRLGAPWVVLHVEVSRYAPEAESARNQVAQALRLGERLGAEAVTLEGDDAATQILDYARLRNASQIVLGKPARPRWRELAFGSIVDDVVRGSGAIDVHVITGEPGDDVPAAMPLRLVPTSRWPGYLRSVGVVAAATLAASLAFGRLAEANLVMVYLLAVVVVARREGRGPSTLAAVLSVAAFDFFFVAPHLTFSVADTEYLVMFAVMLVVGLVVSTLTTRLRRQADSARSRERRTAALYGLSRDLARLRGLDALIDASVRHVSGVFGRGAAVLLRGTDGRPAVRAARPAPFDLPPDELAVAAWVLERGRPAGTGTETLPGASALYLPLTTGERVVGVLAVRPERAADVQSPEPLNLLEAFASLTAQAVARAEAADEAARARVEAEGERLRGTLLGSISHDLRTPLAAIAGSAETLLSDGEAIDAATRRELVAAIHHQAQHLGRLVANLLDMSRLESGGVDLRCEPQSMEEIVGAALARLEALLGTTPVSVAIPADLPLVPCDAILVEQVVLNLIENALKHTPHGTAIDVAAHATPDALVIEVSDRGPGLPAGAAERVFEKFYRGRSGAMPAGAGLGLAICRAIVEAHGGWITAAGRAGGGAVFAFALPLDRAGEPTP